MEIENAFCKRKKKLNNKELETAFLQKRKKKTIKIVFLYSCLGFTKSNAKTTFAIKRSFKINNWYWLFGKKENRNRSRSFFLFRVLDLKNQKMENENDFCKRKKKSQNQ